MDLREQYENYKPHTIGELWTASKTRDTVCDEFIEEAKRVYFDDKTVIRCIELLAVEIRKRG